MTEKQLCKIERAEFGRIPDYPFFFGLILTFKGKSWGIGDGGKYTMNISPDCQYEDGITGRRKAALEVIESTAKVLRDAKVNSVSDLVGIPVEVTLEGNMFKSFRILDEVL